MATKELVRTRKLKKQITIRIGDSVIDWIKQMVEETVVPYQNLIK